MIEATANRQATGWHRHQSGTGSRPAMLAKPTTQRQQGQQHATDARTANRQACGTAPAGAGHQLTPGSAVAPGHDRGHGQQVGQRLAPPPHQGKGSRPAAQVVEVGRCGRKRGRSGRLQPVPAQETSKGSSTPLTHAQPTGKPAAPPGWRWPPAHAR